MSQNREIDAPEDAGLLTFEHADREARSLEMEMGDILVFDTDSKRMGEFGGFFLAEDCGASNYNIPDAPSDPKSRERVNGPNNRIPGIHLPDKVHFALVAAGPLFTTREEGDDGIKEVYHFEAVVFCREVLDRSTNGPAMLKLTAKGPAAVKLHAYMKLDISKGEGSPIQRLNAHFHGLAKKLFEAHKITEERYTNILASQSTAQIFWMPVEIQRGVQIGRSEKKSAIGCMVYTDEPEGGRSKKFKSRWPLVETRLLVTPDTRGGLLMTGPVQKFCQENRARYEEALHARASFKGHLREQAREENPPAEQGEPAPPVTPARGGATTTASSSSSRHASSARDGVQAASLKPEDEKAKLIAEVRRGLNAIGKSETDPDVIKRMEQFGSSTLSAMSPVQMAEFNRYIRGFADRQAARQKKTPQPSSSHAA